MAVASSFLKEQEAQPGVSQYSTSQNTTITIQQKRFHQGTKEPLDLHSAQRHVDSRAAYLDSDDGVQDADCSLERLQEAVLVREHAVLARLDTEADACVDVLGGRLEPCVALCLQKSKAEMSPKKQKVQTCCSVQYLSEDMVQQCVICVVIHG